MTHSLDLLEKSIGSFVMVAISLINVFLIGFGAIRHVFDAKSKDKFKALIVGLGATLAVFYFCFLSRTLQYVHEIIISSYNFLKIKVYEHHLDNTVIVDRCSINQLAKNRFVVNIRSCVMNYKRSRVLATCSSKS